MCALLAAVQGDVAFRTIGVPIDPVGQLRGAIEATGRGDCLDQTRQAGTGNIDGRLRAGCAGPLFAAVALFKTRAIRVHITRLSVLSITVHGERVTPKSFEGYLSNPRYARLVSHLSIDHPASRTAVHATVCDCWVTGGISWNRTERASTNRSGNPLMLETYMYHISARLCTSS